MKEAIKQTQEALQTVNDPMPKMDGLKPAINNLCIMYMPDYLTIKEVDALALVMNQMFWHPEDFLTPKL